MAETDSADAESGFEEDNSEVGANVIKFVSRFVDKVCTDSGVTEAHIKALHQMIPGMIYVFCLVCYILTLHLLIDISPFN